MGYGFKAMVIISNGKDENEREKKTQFRLVKRERKIDKIHNSIQYWKRKRDKRGNEKRNERMGLAKIDDHRTIARCRILCATSYQNNE